MRGWTLGSIVLLVGGALGCSIPEKHDTRQEPLYCSGVALPTSADPTVTLSGAVVEAFSQDPVGGAMVEGHLITPPSTDNPVFTVTADAQGQFSKDQQTLGVPREAYLRATATGYLETRYYPAVPIAHDLETNVQLLTPANIATISSLGGITIDMTKANLLITAVDCNENRLAGVTIATEPAGTVLYFANGQPSTTATMTDAITGTAMIANAPTGLMTITATINNAAHTQMRGHMFTAAANVITQSEIQP